MGWCNGSYIANDVWGMIKDYIPEDKKRIVARMIVVRFEEEDADCWENDMDIVRDAQFGYE